MTGANYGDGWLRMVPKRFQEESRRGLRRDGVNIILADVDRTNASVVY